LDLAAPTFPSALASRSGPSSASAGDGTDGASAGASTVESSSAAILGPTAGERFITMPPSCTEIIAASLPAVADSEHAGSPVAAMAQPPVADLRDTAMRDTDTQAHPEATRDRPTASPAAIAEQP